MAVLKCSKCGYTLEKLPPPEKCPSCGFSCTFVDASCYTPDCGLDTPAAVETPAAPVTPAAEAGIEHPGVFKCANCEFCGREVPADLSCTLILNDAEQVEKACWCICPDCRKSFEEKVVDVFKDLIKK